MPFFAEIRIEGMLVTRGMEGQLAANAAARGDTVPARFGFAFEEELLAAIDSAVARVLLLSFRCPGGLMAPASRLYERLRGFSDAGGLVLAHVTLAGSCAWPLALAADVVAIDPAGEFAVHSAHADGWRDWNRWMARTVAQRGVVPAEVLEKFLRYDAPGATGELEKTAVRAGAARALEYGWADRIATLEETRALAEHPALGGEPPPSPRQDVLRQRRGSC